VISYHVISWFQSLPSQTQPLHRYSEVPLLPRWPLGERDVRATGRDGGTLYSFSYSVTWLLGFTILGYFSRYLAILVILLAVETTLSG
jgi:hypothetical protein